jgi:ankyrin repeat protein
MQSDESDDEIDHVMLRGDSVRLYGAVRNGNVEEARTLLAAGVDVNSLFKRSNENFTHTLLEVAVWRGDARMVQLLVENGHFLDSGNRDIVLTDPSFPTHNPLIIALHSGFFYIAETLIAYNAPITLCTVEDLTPLCMACVHDNADIVTMLLDRGANVDGEMVSGEYVPAGVPNDKYHGLQPPLVVAVYHNNRRVINTLLARGANVNVTSRLGHTPLFEACARGDIDVVRLLLSYHPDIEAASRRAGTYGFTPLARAITNDHAEVARLLIDAGANTNLLLDTTTARGMSLMMLALEHNAASEVFRLLINTMPEIFITFYKNAAGETALEMARRLKNSNAVCWLDFGGHFVKILSCAHINEARWGFLSQARVV